MDRRLLELLHELESHPPGGLDEHDPPATEDPFDLGRAPEDPVAGQFAVQVVGEHRHVEEGVGGQRHLVLVDGPGEQGDLQRPEVGVGPLPSGPRAAVPDIGSGLLVEADGGIEVGDLHRQVAEPGDAHRGHPSGVTTRSTVRGSTAAPVLPASYTAKQSCRALAASAALISAGTPSISASTKWEADRSKPWSHPEGMSLNEVVVWPSLWPW